jgi:hypothetical protein
MLYVRLNSFAFHQARKLGYAVIFTYQQLGQTMLAMKK